MSWPLSVDEQVAALSVLDYLRDLFTASPRQMLPLEDILVILDHVRSDSQIFDQDVVVALEIAQGEVEKEDDMHAGL